MRILLTGATGFLGNNLLRALIRDGHQVTVTLRHSSDLRPLDGLDVEKIYPDLNDPGDVARALENIDLVIHSAALIQLGFRRMEESIRINADATRNMARNCRLKGIRMIFVSSVDALAAGAPDRPADESDIDPAKSKCSYVVSKRKGEQYFCDEIAKGLDGILVNPGFMIGPWDWKPSSGKMMLLIANTFIFFVPGGGLSVADVRDVAEGIVSAMEHGRTGSRYILGGHNMSYYEFWHVMAKAMNRRGPTRRLRNWFAATVGRVGDLVSRFTRNEVDFNSGCIGLGQLYNYYSSDKAEQELGYRIGPIDKAVEDAWDWFRTHGYA